MRAVSPSVVVVSIVLGWFIALVQGENVLYAVIHNRISENNGLYPVQTALVNEVGEMTNFTTNYESRSAQYGVSAFDQKRGILYFAAAGKPPKVLSTDMKYKLALPHTVIGDVDYISNFNFDNVNDRLLLFHEINRELTLASFQDGKLQDLWKLPQEMRIASVGLDEDGQRLLMITNDATGPSSLTILDLTTLQTKSFALSPSCQSHTFLGRMVWSSKQKKAFTFSSAPHPNSDVLDNYVTSIDPETESCESVLINVPFGFVTDCAIDASSDKIYFTQMVNMGDLYFVYDIVKQVALSSAVISPRGVEPLSLAVGPAYADCPLIDATIP